MAVATQPGQALNAEHRCDRCSAQARFRAVLSSGDLVMCAHHFREHHQALLASSAQFYNEDGQALDSDSFDTFA